MKIKVQTAFIGLGSNIGDKQDYLKQAIKLFSENCHVEVINTSSVYCSAPRDYQAQDDFYNMVIQISTNLSANDLLVLCQDIENTIGRVKTIRFGPRIIDADILLYNDELIEQGDTLIIPHQRLHERLFALMPMAEIVGEDYSFLSKHGSLGLSELIKRNAAQDCFRLD